MDETSDADYQNHPLLDAELKLESISDKGKFFAN